MWFSTVTNVFVIFKLSFVSRLFCSMQCVSLSTYSIDSYKYVFVYKHTLNKQIYAGTYIRSRLRLQINSNYCLTNITGAVNKAFEVRDLYVIN